MAESDDISGKSLGQLGMESGPIFWHEISEAGQETSREMTSTDVKFIAAMG